MRQFITVLLIAIFIACAQFVCAQQCTGNLGAPAFSETFGHGTLYEPGPALPDGVTDLYYFADNCGGPDLVPNHPDAGMYTLQSVMGPTCKGGTWQSLNQDHTGDPHGYMMIINAGAQPDVFFTERVPGNTLCPGTTYYFGAFIMNILRDLPSTQGYVEPNITFNIRDATTKAIIKSINTGNLKATDLPQWIPVGTLFTSPVDGADVIIEIANNSYGNGNGNDLALDDITLSPCGPMITNGFNVIGDVTPKSVCENTNINYTLVSQQTGYTNPSYQWQFRNETYGDWQNVTTPGAQTSSLPLSIPNAAIGIYQYRVGVLAGTSTSESCRIYSDPLTINVYPDPVLKIDAVTSGCIGYPVQLSLDVITVYPQGLSLAGDPTFEWSGPSGFTSTESSPFISYNGDPTLNGVYTVKVTKNGCSTFAHTIVNVSLPATINSTSATNVDVCEGDVTQLSVDAKNATTYKWVPAIGLDHDDIANPIANPAVTTTYEVTVSNSGCPDVAPYTHITVNVLKKPQADAGQTIKIFAGQSAQLNGIAKGDKVNYYWTPNLYLNTSTSLTPTATPPQDITYTLHVVSNTICGESTSDVFVRVYQLLTIPNTFTPNGDGINDKWEIKNLITYPNALLSVYNRNGQQVFQNKGGSTAWDGTYNGSPLPVGTYYYIIDLQDDNLPKPAGWVLIVR
ncbi:gliding motility-associated C-terminal domain-containing protein [Mucilaginibacter jinjuensis]|uniref:Gliding motility-associated C-terminal domain-containing protein n=1 Tax=Mucilaginibacter jinjuensis TaxID=1176721 RepID=A0ABY7T7F0_9SPHI|nr:gliding motility-associated C-terminal domain-containing protein [Mucilaginibacter jinjuensis]WCT12214.1 gliding motility-associated C-terminal domain-containing protein [Mucilaginibacter jinjuensis]